MNWLYGFFVLPESLPPESRSAIPWSRANPLASIARLRAYPLVAGLAVAHDRAVTIFPDKRDALRSQYPLLLLMVLYTVGGLWVLSRG